MTPDILIVLIILVCAAVLFASERVPVDLVALLVLGTVLVSGLVTLEEGISGFSNPATVAVAAMFVLSAGLEKTGALNAVGRALTRWGQTPGRLVLATMLIVGAVSAFINNTAAVAVFIPLCLAAARQTGTPPSRVLIPLSYAAQFGGVCTLIGTSTNLLVDAVSRRAGAGEFGMFEFLPLGLVLVVTGTLYLAFDGRWLLPDRGSASNGTGYGLQDYLSEIRVTADSPLIGGRALDQPLFREHEISLTGVIRGEERLWPVAGAELAAGDVLLLRGGVQSLLDFRQAAKCELEPDFVPDEAQLTGGKLALTEPLVAPRSELRDLTLPESRLFERSGLLVLAIRRNGAALATQLRKLRLQVGDSLLLLGRPDDIARLDTSGDLLPMQPVQHPALRAGKARLAAGLVVLVIVLAALKVLPILTAAILGCAALILTRCVTIEEAYEAVDWRVVILLAGVLPLGLAMEKTGAAQLLVQHVLGVAGYEHPAVLLSLLYLLTAILTELMSNTAAAALLAPIALSTAAALGASPRPFLMAVAFAASTSFSTPIGYQTNTMVYNIGGYRFTDFLKVGLPLNVLFWVLSSWLIPKLWPF